MIYLPPAGLFGLLSSVEYQSTGVGMSRRGTPAAPKAKIVLALTGFDNKSGERSTIVQMLKQLVRRIKRHGSSVSANQLAAAVTAATTATAASVSLSSSSSSSAAPPQVEEVTDRATGATTGAVEAAAPSAGGSPLPAKRGRGRPPRIPLSPEQRSAKQAAAAASAAAAAAAIADGPASVVGRRRASSADTAARLDYDSSIKHGALRGRSRSGSGSEFEGTVVAAGGAATAGTESSGRGGAYRVAAAGIGLGFIHPGEVDLMFLDDPDDFSASACTHVIIRKDSTL